MLTVDDYGRIRRAHRDGMSIREMARRFHHSRHKIRRILRNDESEPGIYPERVRQVAPKLAPFHDRILEILKQDNFVSTGQKRRLRVTNSSVFRHSRITTDSWN